MSPDPAGAARTTGAAVRARLGARPAPTDLDQRALALARRRRRAHGATACAGLLAVAALGAAGLFVPLDGAGDAGARSGAPSTAAAVGTAAGSAPEGSAAAVMLSLEDVRALVPGAGQSTPPIDVSGVGAPGGWCRDLPLGGTGSPSSAWAAEWSRQTPAGPTDPDAEGVATAPARSSRGVVREEVLLWPSAAEAAAYTRAVHASPTTCRDPRGDAFPATTWSPQAVGGRADAADAAGAAGDPRGPVLSVAAAPAGTSVPGTPTWRVRAVSARGPAAVSLTTVVRAADATVAARASVDLLDVALARAAGATSRGAGGPGMAGAGLGRPDGGRVSVRGSADETGLGALSMLDADQVSAVAPDLRAAPPPARREPPTAGPGVLVGGWCSGPLPDVPLPDSVWFARWVRPEARSPRPPRAAGGDPPTIVAGVEETLLRFAAPEGASAYAAATRRSSTRCPLFEGSRLPVVQPDRPGSPGRTAVVGPGPVEGSWSVRAVDARDDTVVVLSLLVPAPDAAAAAALGQDLVDVALARAAGEAP